MSLCYIIHLHKRAMRVWPYPYPLRPSAFAVPRQVPLLKMGRGIFMIFLICLARSHAIYISLLVYLLIPFPIVQGEVIPSQVSGNTIRFAASLPPMGHATYFLVPASESSSVKATEVEVRKYAVSLSLVVSLLLLSLSLI